MAEAQEGKILDLMPALAARAARTAEEKARRRREYEQVRRERRKAAQPFGFIPVGEWKTVFDGIIKASEDEDSGVLNCTCVYIAPVDPFGTYKVILSWMEDGAQETLTFNAQTGAPWTE